MFPISEEYFAVLSEFNKFVRNQIVKQLGGKDTLQRSIVQIRHRNKIFTI